MPVVGNALSSSSRRRGGQGRAERPPSPCPSASRDPHQGYVTASRPGSLDLRGPAEQVLPARPQLPAGPHVGALGHGVLLVAPAPQRADRKSTRLNSSHVEISYAVFCLKKKKKK